MTGFAILDVLRPFDIGEVVDTVTVTDDHVTIPASVNVVDQRLHVDGIHGVAIDRRRVVADYAILDVRARAAMKLEAIMAGIARVVVDYLAFEGRQAAGRHEIVYTI